MSESLHANPRLRILRFEAAIENVVKRHHPMRWAIEAAKRLKKWGQYPGGKVVWTPHELLDSIEACCRYRRGSRDEPVTEKRLRQAVSVYREHGDPYSDYLLSVEKDLDLWTQVIRRQQLELQMSSVEQAALLASHVWLMSDENAFPESDHQMRHRFGFTSRQLLASCVAIQGTADEHDFSLIPRKRLDGLRKLGVSPAAIDLLLERCSRSLEQVRDDYKHDKADALKSPQLRFSLRSAFLDHPLVTDGQSYVAPLPHLVTRALGRLYSQLGTESAGHAFEREMATRFENLVSVILKEIFPSSAIHREERIQRYATGKVCDFVVETIDSIVLVECKATRVTSRFIVKGALAKDTSTRRIVEGLRQAAEMAVQIRDGVFSNVITNNELPILPIVVTLDELPFPNSEWYWNNAVMPNIDTDAELQRLLSMLACRPQVMSATGFGSFAVHIANTNASPLAAVSAKLDLAYTEVGDWSTYLESRMPPGKPVVPGVLLQDAAQVIEEIQAQLTSDAA